MRDYIWSLQKKITKGGEEEEEEPGGGRGFTHKTLNSTPSNSRDIREGGGGARVEVELLLPSIHKLLLSSC